MKKLIEKELRIIAAPCGSHCINEKEITSPKDAVDILIAELAELACEKIMAVFLTTKGRPICCQTVGVGNVNCCQASVQSVVKMALLVNAANVILMHNHPSTCLIPSQEDVSFTNNAKEGLRLVEIGLIDHIIVGPDKNFYSFKEHGFLE